MERPENAAVVLWGLPLQVWFFLEEFFDCHNYLLPNRVRAAL
ncbi:MAG TPA: hypothetical protein VKK79_26065 [Candidatus Lokiarchaeia archaeon]|nr:hypothetical protein [Candidatus Lokiarchaeia archaeon]